MKEALLIFMLLLAVHDCVSQVKWPLLNSPVSGFTSYTNVFGVGVIAHSSISSTKFQHVCAVLAAWLDNDQDGCTDNPKILPKLVNQNPRPVVVVLPGENFNLNPNKFTNAGLAPSVALYNNEIKPGCSGTLQTSSCVDATLEETWHLVTSQGFSKTWTAELGETNSLMSQAMDVARGGKFQNVPSQYPQNAWYTYYDTTCTYKCMATEYFYWAVAAWVGALKNQEDRIKNEWKPNTRQKLKKRDKKMTALIEDKTKWILPNIAPNGKYSATSVCNGGQGHGGSTDGQATTTTTSSSTTSTATTASTTTTKRPGGNRLNGEEACEGHGYSQGKCQSIGCCEWDDNQCWSAVGRRRCRRRRRN